MTSDLHLAQEEVALLTDLYELTMAASYLEHGFNEPACFSLSVRRLPQRRGYLVAAGLERFFQRSRPCDSTTPRSHTWIRSSSSSLSSSTT